MRTLIITLEYPPQVGGIASYVYNLAGHLPADETLVYAPKMKGGADFDAKYGWKTVRANPYWFFIWPKWLRMLFQVWKIVRREKIEMIYVHHALPVGYVARFIKKIKKIPYVIFLHGSDLEIGSRLKKNKLENVCRDAEMVVVNSNFMRGKLLSRLDNLKEDKIRVLYPGPADFFFKQEDAAKIKKIKSQLALESKKVILTVSRMTEGKGYIKLARLLPKIIKIVPNLVWLIVGDGPKRQAMLEMIQKDSLQNAIRFLGEIPQGELPKYFQAADLFVLLTHPDAEGEEGWGTVFLEAAASGVPSVAGKSGGVEEAVINQETGILVDANKDDDVVSAIVKLLGDDVLRRGMGERAKARAENNLRWEKQILKLKI